MRYVGIPTCPYCRKRVNLIRTWSLKRQGEYQCPRCGGISNIFLSPLVYVLALLAVFGGGAMYFFHKFVLDDISLETALYVFVPFAAFFLLSLFMVYLEKPVIKKVPKSEYNKRRNKNSTAEAYDRSGEYHPEPNTGYISQTGGQQRHAEAPAPVTINQENFNRAKQQTASINAIHESGGVPVPAPRQEDSQRPATVQQRPVQQIQPQERARPAASQRSAVDQLGTYQPQRAVAQRESQPQRSAQPVARPRTEARATDPMPYQRPVQPVQQRTGYPRTATQTPDTAQKSEQVVTQRPVIQQRSAHQRAYTEGQVPEAYAAYRPRNAVGQHYDPPRRTTRVTSSVERPSVSGSILEKYNEPGYVRRQQERPVQEPGDTGRQ